MIQNHFSCHDFPWLCELTMIVSTTCHPCLFLWIWLHHRGGGSHSQGDSQGKLQTSRNLSRILNYTITIDNNHRNRDTPPKLGMKNKTHEPPGQFPPVFQSPCHTKNPDETCINSFTKGTFDADHQSHQAYGHQLLHDFHPKILTWGYEDWNATTLETYTNQGSTRECFDLYPYLAFIQVILTHEMTCCLLEGKGKGRYTESSDCKTLSLLTCQNVLWISLNPNSVSVPGCEWMIKDGQILDIMDTSQVLSMYFESKCWEPSRTRSLGATTSRMDLSWSIRAMVRHLLGLKLVAYHPYH